MYVTLIHADRERERDRASLRSSQCFNLWHVRCTFFQVWRRAFESGQLSRSNVIHLQRTVVSEHQGPFGTSVSHRGWIGDLVLGLVGWWVFVVVGVGRLQPGYWSVCTRRKPPIWRPKGTTVWVPIVCKYLWHCAWGNSRLVFKSPHFIFRFGENKPWFGLSQQIFKPPGLKTNNDIWIWASHALVPLITLQSHLVKVKFLSYCKYRIFSRAFKELHKYSWFLSHV